VARGHNSTLKKRKVQQEKRLKPGERGRIGGRRYIFLPEGFCEKFQIPHKKDGGRDDNRKHGTGEAEDLRGSQHL